MFTFFFHFYYRSNFFVSCKAKSPHEEQNIQFNYDVTTVSFLGEERNEKMDVYQPVPIHKLKSAVLLIHGGGCTRGNKDIKRAKSIAIALAEEGYAVFSIDYHLTKFFTLPSKVFKV